MADNTVTIVLDGEVPLAEFAKAIIGFNELVIALSDEVGGVSLDWIVNDLQVGSALASASGKGESKAVSKVIAAYADVGASLEHNAPLKYREPVKNAVAKIISIEDHRVSTVRFETAITDSVVKLRQGKVLDFPESKTLMTAPDFTSRGVAPAYGAITGRIQTLTSRGGLRFTLFDTLHDKAVSCYFTEGRQEQIRDMWGHMAIVEGVITRDPLSGRPISIREVGDITPVREPIRSFNYQEARGVAPSLNGVTPEEAIRRIRDAN